MSTVAHTENCASTHIGGGIGVRTWVVNPVNCSRLALLGATGELWLEGPIVGPGYYNDPDKTVAAFADDPPWLLHGTGESDFPGRRGRLYKTGDLVRYNSDGSLSFVGRKDSQVKIRGQRIELNEVEHHIRQSLSSDQDIQVVVEAITPKDSTGPSIVAFIGRVRDDVTDDDERLLRSVTARMDENLSKTVPTYMIPTAYVPLHIPMTVTGKTNRRQLRNIGAQMSVEELATFHPSRAQKRAPGTPREIQLRNLWATILRIDPTAIGADDFFSRFGDSIGAMRLVAAARQSQPPLQLSVADVFACRLSDLAKVAQELKMQARTEAIPPFSLLPPASGLTERVTQGVARLCKNLAPSQVEDVYPCTPLQMGLLALTAKRPGDYVAQMRLELRQNIDISRFRQAWEKVAETPILRTCIVDLADLGLVQAVIQKAVYWHEFWSMDDFLQSDVATYTMGLGTPLTKTALVHDQDKVFFVLTMHHAVYDGWSLPRYLGAAAAAYEGSVPQLLPFSRFVQHVRSLDNNTAAEMFWRGQFQKSEAVHFPDISHRGPTFQPQSDKRLEHDISVLHWPKSDHFTAASVIRSAWALLTSHYMCANDVVFGAVAAGRQAPVSEIEDIAGPTIATVPVRVALDHTDSECIADLVARVHQQAIEMTAFEQTGLQQIRRISIEAEQCCNFQTLLVVQPPSASQDNALFEEYTTDLSDGPDSFSIFALLLNCELRSDAAKILISFDSSIISQAQVTRILFQFETVLRQLCTLDLRRAYRKDINVASKLDLEDIYKWNAAVPESVDACVHDMVCQNATQRPNGDAICAWDGQLSYAELDGHATRLAQHLIELGVRPSRDSTPATIVPLCFEKSMYMPVAMLAVMKAGGTSTALDVTHPRDRLRSISQQVGATVVLSSASHYELAQCLAHTVVKVDRASLDDLANDVTRPLPRFSSSNALYVVFTSGSTGVPKAAVVTHRNFASAIRHQQQALGFDATSRVYDYASYGMQSRCYSVYLLIVS